MNKYLHLSIYVLVVYSFTVGLKCLFDIDYGEYAKPSFLFNYLGVLLGFAITLYTFIVSQYDSILNKINQKHEQLEDRLLKKQSFNEVCSEVKDDVSFVFYSLLLVVIISLIPTDIFISIPEWVSKKSVYVTIFVLSIFAIHDLIYISFKIADYIGVNDKE